MRLIAEITPAEVLWQWALAEWDSTRFRDWYPDVPGAAERLRTGLPYDRTQDVDQRIIRAVAYARGSLLADVPPESVAWWRGALETHELAALRTLALPEFRTLAPDSALLSGMSAALENGHDARADIPFLEPYREMRAMFDPARIRGMPILLAERAAGPFHLLEGYRRMTLLHARFSAGTFPEQEIAVVVGIWPRLKGWRLYHDVDAPYQALK